MSVRFETRHLGGFIGEKDFKGIEDEVRAAARSLDAGSCKGNDYIGWIRLPENYDRDEFARIKAAAKRIRETSDVLVVIGIGGSYLGARAVIELLGGQFFNEFSPLKVLFAGNGISGDYLNAIIKQCEGRRVSVNVVSKSGTTTEPAVAFRVFKKLLEERYGKEEAAKRIYATTDRARGTLKSLADAEGYECFVIPDDVGGRYSVLTAVGLLPIAAAGFDIDALMEGAREGMTRFANDDPANDCNRYAAARSLLYRGGKTTEILACYEPAFTMFNEWWKQLFGESEGKDGKGLFPASMIFSTDLHSMGQYVQQGLRNLSETVVRFLSVKSDVTIETAPEDFDGLNYLGGRTMSFVNENAMLGTILAHCEGGVPCGVVEVDDMREKSVGELIYFFQRACAVSGCMLGVNPFNQPGVESYKKNMFALLGKPGYEKEREQLLKKL